MGRPICSVISLRDLVPARHEGIHEAASDAVAARSVSDTWSCQRTLRVARASASSARDLRIRGQRPLDHHATVDG